MPQSESFPPGLTRPRLLAEEGGWTVRGTQNDSRCFQDMKQINAESHGEKVTLLQVSATFSSHSLKGPGSGQCSLTPCDSTCVPSSGRALVGPRLWEEPSKRFAFVSFLWLP